MTLAGRVFSNRYEIQRELAQGGMAEVYLARDQLLNRLVALKALFPEYAREPSFVERFRREAQAAANLNHPNIVAIYDWGQESGTYFIVMEYVEGRSLRELIRSEAPLDADQAAEITAETAAALAFAHRAGVVHRDVKPGNVLLTRSGNVKVTDFGIARAGTSDGLTQTGSVMGTATYFSPEQAQGQPVDGRSDVYSLGVVLYELVTGVAPFTGDSPVSVAYKHVREDAVPPSERNPDVPADLEQIILTALAKDPDHRYQSADDMRADLLRFRRGRPLAAAPVTAMVAEVPTTAVPAGATAAGVAAYNAAGATAVQPRVDDRGRYGTGPAYPRKKRNTALVWILTILGLAAVIGAILFAATKLGGSQAQVKIPNEVGKNVADAEKDLQNNHLTPDVKRVPNALVKVDLVISQSPPANSNAARGSTVTLTVSSGAAQVQIPFDIINQPYTKVADELTRLHLQPKNTPQADPTITVGNVINSNPKPGDQVAINSQVEVFVSSGPSPVPVPDVSKQPAADAKAALNAAGFTNVQTLQESSDKVQSGLVTRTDPAAGSPQSPTITIKMYVSTGPTQVTVNSEIGKTFDVAQNDLQHQGLNVSKLFATVDNPGNVGLVVRQDPSAGTQVNKSSSVTLYVGQLSSPSTTAGATTTTGP